MSENKSWYKRWWAITLFILIGIVIIISFLPDSDNQQQTICNKPYILVGTSCCLDNDNNSICDVDENQEIDTQSEPIILSDSSSYQSCIKEIFKSECEKYGLLYTDYSSAVQFITCTDDGVYSMDDIGDDSKYLQVYISTRILEIKCGTYTEPTNSKLKCEEDFFEEQCEKEDLIYTDWSAAVGFITCTDDGIYTLNEIGEDTKYKQVYVTSEFVDTKCP